jgi:cell division protein FtsI/penicillin-binding protein 2
MKQSLPFLAILSLLLLSWCAKPITSTDDTTEAKLQSIVQQYNQEFSGDATEILVYDYTNGQVKYSVSYPITNGNTKSQEINFEHLMKPFIYAVALDNGSIKMDGVYSPLTTWETTPFEVPNADPLCDSIHTFNEAFVLWCNDWAIRAFQSLETSWTTAYDTFVKDIRGFWFDVYDSWALNLAQQIPAVLWRRTIVDYVHLAVAYGALINSGTYIEPSVDGKWIHTQVISPETSTTIKSLLTKTISENKKFDYLKIYWDTIWWYSLGTDNMTTFVWFIDNPKDIVVVTVSNPKTKKTGYETAGVIFGEVVRQLNK